MRQVACGWLMILLALSTVSPAPAENQPLPPGTLFASGDQSRFSLRAREVPAESLLLNVRAQTGLTIVAPIDALVTVEFDDLPARAGASRIGETLGGLVALRASWDDPAPGARHKRVDAYYLVRPGSRRQRLLGAFALEQGGAAHERLGELLRAEGATLLPDAAAQAQDGSRSERERILTIGLIGSLGGAGAATELAAILGSGTGAFVRRAAASALGVAGDAAATPALRAALADPDAGVALSAAGGLVRLGDLSGVPLALAQLRGKDVLLAAQVVAATADPSHIPALEAALAQSEGLARLRLRTAIADLSAVRLDEAGRIAAAERLLADPDFELRRHGARALAGIGTPAAMNALERLAADPARTGAGEAAEAVARLRRPRRPPPEIAFD